MKKPQLAMLCALSVGAVAAYGQTYDNYNPSLYIGIGEFGNGDVGTATFGQTFTAPSTSTLSDWTIYLKNMGGTPQNFEFFLMAWNGSSATGPVLYQSALQTISASVTNLTAFSVAPNVGVTGGGSYVMFINESGLNDGPPPISGKILQWGNNTSLLGGEFVYLDNGDDFSEVTTTPWSTFADTDAAYIATFVAAAQAQFTCATNGDGSITLTKYTGPGGAVVIPGYVTIIGQDAFYNCTNLGSVIIPNSVTNLGDDAFANCLSLTNVAMGSGVATIGDYAFADCENLAGLIIPNSVTSIGDYAFSCMFSLTNFTIPDSVTSLGDAPFQCCIDLTAISVGTNNPSFISVGGILFNKGQGALIQYPAAKTGHSYAIPNTVTNIEDYAFEECTNLASVTIPGSVTRIGDGAFDACVWLTNVFIPNSVTNIGAGPFAWCAQLTAIGVATNNPAYISVGGVLFNKVQTALIQYPNGKAGSSYAIPNSVINIGDSAFNGCLSLTSVTIPGSVTSIADYAFNDCQYLRAIYFLGNAPSADPSVFYGGDNVIAYYLPGTTGWLAFTANADIQAMLWNPVFQASGASFGMQSNQFGFNITGTSNIPIALEACTDLSCPVWISLTNVTLTNGSFYFGDAQCPNYPCRFYRIRLP